MAKDLDYYLAQARRISAHREADAEKEIRKLYKSMLKDLQTFMSETYIKYAEDDKLTFAMLQKAGYDARFLEEIAHQINVTGPKTSKKLRALVEETYKASYEAMVKGVAAQELLDETFTEAIAITPEQIKAGVENPVSGLTLKDTLEKNRKEIIYSIKQAVNVGLMNGDRYTTMASRIAEQLDGDYTKAVRIARTEAHRVREAGNIAAAENVDTELQKGTTGMRMVKTWKTMKDERVRPQYKSGKKHKMGKGANHMILDGQMVLANEPFDLGYYKNKKVEAKAPGQSGVAGHDINCRCYTSYQMLTDEEYFKETGKHFPGWIDETIVKSELVDSSIIKAPRGSAWQEMTKGERDEALTLCGGRSIGVDGDSRIRFFNTSNGYKIGIVNKDAEVSVKVQKDIKEIYLDMIWTENNGEGRGTEIIVDIVDAAKEQNYYRITAFGAGAGGANDGYNGYYTLPRLGFDGILSDTDQIRAKEAGFIVTNVSELMDTPEGRKWWKENGSGLDLSFDLTDGSKSFETLNEYMKKRKNKKD